MTLRQELDKALELGIGQGNYTSLKELIQKHTFEELKSYLPIQYYRDYNLGPCGLLPLMCELQQVEMVQLLLDKGFKSVIEQRAYVSGNNITPLHQACMKQNIEMVKLLLQYGANIDAHGADIETPISPDTEWLFLNEATPLQIACSLDNMELSQLLCDKQADARGALNIACQSGSMKVAQWLLLDQKVDIESIAPNVLTPMLAACKGGHPEMAQWLFGFGANIEAIDRYNRTALHHACEGGHLEVARWLLEHGVKTEVIDQEGKTALHLACRAGHSEVAQLLLQHGAKINVKHNHDKTPLYVACEYGKIDVIKALLAHRDADGHMQADVSILPARVLTLMKFFQDGSPDHEKMRELLRSAGCAEVSLLELQSPGKKIRDFTRDSQNVHKR